MGLRIVDCARPPRLSPSRTMAGRGLRNSNSFIIDSISSTFCNFMDLLQISSFRLEGTLSQQQAASSQQPTTRSRKPEAGFTLMEVLVAITILAVVVTTILASFNSVFSTTEVLDESANIYEMGKNCMKRLAEDLESIHITQRPLYKPPEFDQPPDPYRIVTTAADIDGMGIAQLRFASRAHISLEKGPAKGIAEIIYYVQAGNEGDPVLKRADNLYPYPAFEERGSDPVLCKYVKSLAFKFYSQDGTESDAWDSDSDEFGHATPKAIAITLELANKASSHAFETMVSLPVFREKSD